MVPASMIPTIGDVYHSIETDSFIQVQEITPGRTFEPNVQDFSLDIEPVTPQTVVTITVVEMNELKWGYIFCTLEEWGTNYVRYNRTHLPKLGTIWRGHNTGGRIVSLQEDEKDPLESKIVLAPGTDTPPTEMSARQLLKCTEVSKEERLPVLEDDLLQLKDSPSDCVFRIIRVDPLLNTATIKQLVEDEDQDKLPAICLTLSQYRKYYVNLGKANVYSFLE